MLTCHCTETTLCTAHVRNRTRISHLYSTRLAVPARSLEARMLIPGQIIRRHGGDLWQVVYVNECRARITPLNESREEVGTRSLDISPNSMCDVVADRERAVIEMELRKAEREIAAAKRELAEQEKTAMELKAVEAEIAALKKEAEDTPMTALPVTPRGATASPRGKQSKWTIAPGDHPFNREGSLKAIVMTFLKTHPGATTKEVAAGAPKHSPGAVAACLDRFWDAGILIKN